MLSNILALLFIIKLKLSRSNSIIDYISSHYDLDTLRSFRKLESLNGKLRKATLDLEFLQYCQLNNLTPKFIKFKLYKKSLYSTDFYSTSTNTLLQMEIKFKNRIISKHSQALSDAELTLKSKVSKLDFIYIKKVIKNRTLKYSEKIRKIHDKKLTNLGIHKPAFQDNSKIITNLSSRVLSKRETFLLTLGLEFALPCFKPNFPRFFYPFEVLASQIKTFADPLRLPNTLDSIREISNRYFSKIRNQEFWTPFFTNKDYQILKTLSKDPNIVISRPDKGRGVVLQNRTDYLEKMHCILSDQQKFSKIDTPIGKLINSIEDKINRFLRSIKEQAIITQDIYNQLYSSGSSIATIYGLPKTHKTGTPLRPILAAYNLATYPLAKYLVPMLSHLTRNEYSIKNSYEFADTIPQQNSNSFMVSFDIVSLFTNIPLGEVIGIILDKVFCNTNYFNGFTYDLFKKLLELVAQNCYFLFNNTIYKQTEGVAMGSPIGPTFANIFMCHLENIIINECPADFKPNFYKRYVDDTFALFHTKLQAENFFIYINNIHPNIKFTMETESQIS